MSLIFPLALSALAGAAQAPQRHFRHYRRSGRLRAVADGGTQPAPAATDAGGESFVMGGRRYYWFLQGGRRVYSSHPPTGYQSVSGPTPGGATGTPAAGHFPGGVADLDEPLSPTERAAQAARARQAQARLASLEHRIGRLRHLERLRAHPARPPKKRR